MTAYRTRSGAPVDATPYPGVPGWWMVRTSGGLLLSWPAAAVSELLEPVPVPPPVPTPAPAPAGTEFGVWFSGAEPASDYQAAAAAGFKWARVRWFSAGPEWQSQTRWAREAVTAARAAGLKVLFEYWAWGNSRGGDVPTVALVPWADISAYLAGLLGADVAAVQIANEPDIAPLGLCPAWPTYVAAAARAWRERTQALVIAPGIAGEAYAGSRPADVASLATLAASVDVLALHHYVEDYSRTYTPGGSGLAGKVAWLRALTGGWTGPVWQTEGGGISGPATQWQPRRSETQQAADAVRFVQEARAARLPVACHFAWRDQPGQTERHGLCREDGTPKPALAAISQAMRG